MEVKILVTVPIDDDGVGELKVTTEEVRQSALDAVSNALESAGQNGFSHPLAYSHSIGEVTCELVKG